MYKYVYGIFENELLFERQQERLREWEAWESREISLKN